LTAAMSGALSGGIMSALMGGSFWEGARTGAISAGVSAWLGTVETGSSANSAPTGNVCMERVRNWFNNSLGTLGATGEYRFNASDALALSGVNDEIDAAMSDAVDKPAVDCPTLSEAADIADHIYGKKGAELSGGWELVDVYSPEGTGLRMGVYARVGADGKTEYVIANKGSSTWGNWGDNAKQLFGNSPDMTKSIEYATAFVKNHPDADITFVGHSKGGAEAAANAVATNRNAILFNPASVNLRAIGLNSATYTGNMTAYIVKNEPLNFLFGGISKPIGSVVYLPQQSWWNPLYNHSMAGVKKAINEWEGIQ